MNGKRHFILFVVFFLCAALIAGKTFAATNVCNVTDTITPKFNSAKNIEKDTLNFNVIIDDKDELLVVQWRGINYEDREVQLIDADEKIIQKTVLFTGSTVAYFDIQTIYNGAYWVRVSNGKEFFLKKILIKK